MGRITRNVVMTLRVSEEESDMIKKAAQLKSYSSCSEFIRRTIVLEAKKAISDDGNNANNED
ncbi:MAG: DUF1778 domain-containing protein [bacterium]|nr:DUF1778 domain-containing protein [bacterium]